MNVDGLVLAVLDTSAVIDDPKLSERFRGFTISWSRYGYRGRILEGPQVDGLLAEAHALGYRYCLLQPYGHIIHEQWTPDGRDFFSELAAQIDEQDFLAMGPLVGDADSWYGFQLGCLLVNLEKHRQLEFPTYDAAGGTSRPLPALPQRHQGVLVEIVPTQGSDVGTPQRSGWHLIAASLAAGIPVRGFRRELQARSLDLEATNPQRSRALANYLDRNIERFQRREHHSELTADQATFLSVNAAQTAHARKGVFLWNIESYADIEEPRSDFRAPVSSLYSVAAGFKPLRILATHGFNEATRMVYFDYSPNALEVRQCMVREWDGDDFPHFVKYLFHRFPHPETFYQLWQQRTPDDVAGHEIEAMWAGELARWGGAAEFAEHWRACRQLKHDYVCCNLLADASPLLAAMTDQPSQILWWSNAFFTMYGNWYYPVDERQQLYERWIKTLAEKNPSLYLFGSDYINSNVNYLQASEYWQQYRALAASCLNPCHLYHTEIRM